MKRELVFLFLLVLIGCTTKVIPPDPVSVEIYQPETVVEPVPQHVGIVNCKDMDCFGRNFVECRPAILQAFVTEGLVFEYEILGQKSGGCETRHVVLAHPDPNWAGQWMTCVSDARTVSTALADIGECHGPLHELMEPETPKKEIEETIIKKKPSVVKVPTPDPAPPITTTSRDVSVDIIMPKTNYDVGEKVENARHFYENEGSMFRGAVIFSKGKVGYSARYHGMFQLNIVTGDSDNEMIMANEALTAFEYNDDGYAAVTSNGAWKDPGTYIYQISLYDCAEVEKALGKPCGDAKHDEIYTLSPLTTKSQNVIVTGTSAAYGCNVNEDCPSTCANCKHGRELCTYPARVCQACITSLECNSGFSCAEGKCI